MDFSVWAPSAGEVALDLVDRRVAMHPCGGGWWAVTVDVAHPADYGFVLDGGDVLPDPRSPWQPEGPHGHSRTWDVGEFPWTDAGWSPPDLASGVVYELHLGTFTAAGTCDAAIDKLDHLVELGITHVEVMPVAAFPGRWGWGYDGVDLYAVHDAYGGPAAFARFVDAAHGRGLAVILDVVYNHLGPDGNYLASFGRYFRSDVRTPWGDALNYDGRDSVEVRRFVIDNALRWLRDFHVDGLRLDATHAIHDESAVPLLAELAAEVRTLETDLGRRLVLIAEDDRSDPRVVGDLDRGGWGLTAQWADDLHHAIHVALTGELSGYYGDYIGGLGDVATALTEPFLYARRYSPYRRKIVGSSPRGIPDDRFLVCLQNHDQVGNRAAGDRLTHTISPELAMVGAALVLLGPYVPMVFQGEEWAASSPFAFFSDHVDPTIASGVTDGRREEFAEFGWDPAAIPDPQDPATFHASKLQWAELDHEPHATMLRWYRDVLELRRGMPAARSRSSTSVTLDAESQWLVVDREAFVVAVNLAAEGRRVPVESEGVVRLASADGVAVGDSSVWLPAGSVAIMVP